MIRFRTIEPETATKADEAPATAPAASRPEQAPLPDAGTKVRRKGLTRKTPLRTRKQESARLFPE